MEYWPGTLAQTGRGRTKLRLKLLDALLLALHGMDGRCDSARSGCVCSGTRTHARTHGTRRRVRASHLEGREVLGVDREARLALLPFEPIELDLHWVLHRESPEAPLAHPRPAVCCAALRCAAGGACTLQAAKAP